MNLFGENPHVNEIVSVDVLPVSKTPVETLDPGSSSPMILFPLA